ncbi:MAG: beta-ketoacyl-[acyl-carrier-protein] synthase II [Spirochaetes bacterium]|nr:MAG: beta-ketoacyl-[acyl-carrier-protein] synthase II [Spirochaetota bacterium]
MYNNRRVVITGLGTINPIGNNIKEYWDNLQKGKSGVRLAKNVDLSDYYVKIAGEIDLPDVSQYFRSKRDLKRLDRYIILGHVAGCQSIEDSGVEIQKAPERYGTLIGVGKAGLLSHWANIPRIYNDGMHSCPPYYIVSGIPNTGTAFLAKEWGLRGPSFTVSSACATSNHAIGLAVTLIKSGMADAMFVGGAEAIITRPAFAAFGNIMAISDRNDSPETASRPFDVDRNGFVISEGAGVLCIEELEHALKRDAHIYCEITGVGFSCDAYDMVAPHPEGRGASQSMEMALNSAQLNPEDIGLINCHGTSTPIGDKVESDAIIKSFGNYGTKVPAHSTKSMTGHMIGAAGAAEAIAAIMVYEKGVVHPSINIFNQDPEIRLNVVKEPMENKKINHILSNGFGFGGQNASIVLSRFRG